MKILNRFKKQVEIMTLQDRNYEVKEVSAWLFIDAIEFLADNNLVKFCNVLNVPQEGLITASPVGNILNMDGLEFLKTFIELNIGEDEYSQEILGEEERIEVFEAVIDNICSIAIIISTKFLDPETLLNRYSLKQLKYISSKLWSDKEDNSHKKGYHKSLDEFGNEIEEFEE
jgi:hypothetical protein